MKIPTLTLIHDRMGRGNGGNAVSVDLRITYERKQKFIATGVKVTARQWDSLRQMVVGCPEAMELNKLLGDFKQNALKVIGDMMSEGAIDLASLPRLIKCRSYEMTFIEYVGKRMVERNVRESTRKRYEGFLNFLLKWQVIVTFADVNEGNLRRMDEYLRAQGLKVSSINNYHKYMKIFIRDAIIDGLMKSDPYVRVKFKRPRYEPTRCLTKEQLAMLKTLTFNTPYLDRVRDLFVFQCYSGLAYSDLMSFDIKDYVLTEGVWASKRKRTKTDVGFLSVLLQPCVAILKKYDWKLPKISNEKYNLYLKAVGMAIGVDRLHSHMGRATFISMMVSCGVKTENVAKMVGHTDIKMTQHYTTIYDEDIINDYKKINSSL